MDKLRPETEDVLRRLSKCDTSLTDESVAAALEEASLVWERTARLVSMRGVAGAPDWLQFERLLWDFGESLRLCFVKQKSWRSWVKIFDVVADRAIDGRFHKGRQSLVLLLGQFSAAKHADVLRRLIDDTEVRGHALMALRTGKVADVGLMDRVRFLSEHERGWVRTEAKKYLKFLLATDGASSGEK